MVGGGLIYGAWIGAFGGMVAAREGAAAGLATAAGLLGLAFAGVHAVEREAAVMRMVRAFFALRQTPLAARAALRRQRAALAEVLDQTHAWLDEPRGDEGGATRERPG